MFADLHFSRAFIQLSSNCVSSHGRAAACHFNVTIGWVPSRVGHFGAPNALGGGFLPLRDGMSDFEWGKKRSADLCQRRDGCYHSMLLRSLWNLVGSAHYASVNGDYRMVPSLIVPHKKVLPYNYERSQNINQEHSRRRQRAH